MACLSSIEKWPLVESVGAVKEYLGVESIHLASRLDRETSGVVLLAKHRGAASKWQKGIGIKNSEKKLPDDLGGIGGSREISTFLGKILSKEVFVKQRVTENSRNPSGQSQLLFRWR